MGDTDFLDFDITLDDDAQRFGLKAQGDARIDDTEPVQVAPVTEVVTKQTLHEALVIAKEIYGETNSGHSEAFCHWVDDVLLGTSSVRETKAMLEILHADKEGFGGRMCWFSAAHQNIKAGRLRARRHASICAMNVARAVLNKFHGLNYEQWIARSLYRATKAEEDSKSNP